MRDPDGQGVQVQLPVFTRAMRVAAAVFGVVWLLEALLSGTRFMGAQGNALGPFQWLALTPASVLRGEVWRLATYALLHDPHAIVSVFFTVLTLWFFGGDLERRMGLKRLGLLALMATLMGSVLVTLAGALYLPLAYAAVVGPGAASAAMAVAWGRSVGEQPMSFFGVVKLTGKQFTYVMVGLVLVGLLVARNGASLASAGGLVAGFVFGRKRPPPPRSRTVSSPRLKVVRGGKDLPN